MNSARVIHELNIKYPNKNIVVNDKSNPTEIICEIDPASKHPEYSVIVAVIDSSIKHRHGKSTEKYEVLKGELIVTRNAKRVVLKKGQVITIMPGEQHSTKGKNTWVKITSKPGWDPENHVLPKIGL